MGYTSVSLLLLYQLNEALQGLSCSDDPLFVFFVSHSQCHFSLIYCSYHQTAYNARSSYIKHHIAKIITKLGSKVGVPCCNLLTGLLTVARFPHNTHISSPPIKNWEVTTSKGSQCECHASFIAVTFFCFHASVSKQQHFRLYRSVVVGLHDTDQTKEQGDLTPPLMHGYEVMASI